MRNIDFFSQSPNIFIFHKASNQTTFGGILFLIYLLIMIIISLIYILDYALNNKYIVENISYINSTRKQSDNPFAYWDIYDEKILDYNPVLNVSFNLFKVNESNPANISDKFVVVDAYHFLPLERKTVFQTNISSLGFIIVYLCDDEECSLDDDDDHNALGYMFELKYSGFQLDHQGDIPLIKDDSTFFVNFYCFSFTSTVLTLLNWEIVRYEESKGMLGIFDKWSEEEAGYTGGYISLKGNTFLTHPIIRTNIIQGKRVKLLAEFLLTNVLNTEYRRKKISFLDVLANIGALFMTIYSVFLFIFNYYSKNFNNYQIIKSIMNKKTDKLSQNVKPKSNEKLIRMEKELDDINNNDDDEKKLHLITNYDNRLSINNEENSDIELENTEELRKFSFFQFFLNNIYNKSCCKLNEQEIIGLINKITVNYLSIDLILYNQIMIENILKDYHWNDVKLKDINNNENIIKLRNLLKKPV